MKLNIACGPNVFPDWVNLDRDDVEANYLCHLRPLKVEQMDGGWLPEQKRLVEWLNAGRITFKRKDLREGFAEYADGSVDAIYLGQVVEHLNPIHELPKLLAECYRMLRVGGAVRITTPDLAYIISEFPNMEQFAADQPAFYADARPLDQLSYLLFGATGENCTQEHYEGHFHVHYLSGMMRRLGDAGFTGEIGTADHFRNPLFADCIDKGMSHSFSVEAVK